MSGVFIVIEGPDGSGTTRHSQVLAEKLHAVLTKEPTASTMGNTIRSLLKNDGGMAPETLQLLFCADRAQHTVEVITPALVQEKTVVSDRYTLSTIIYGEAMGVDREWLEKINNHFPKPDLTIITLPPFETCMERIGRREDHDMFEAESIQRRVYDGYKNVEDPSVVFVDTTPDKDEVANHIEGIVCEKFPEVCHPELVEG